MVGSAADKWRPLHRADAGSRCWPSREMASGFSSARWRPSSILLANGRQRQFTIHQSNGRQMPLPGRRSWLSGVCHPLKQWPPMARCQPDDLCCLGFANAYCCWDNVCCLGHLPTNPPPPPPPTHQRGRNKLSLNLISYYPGENSHSL